MLRLHVSLAGLYLKGVQIFTVGRMKTVPSPNIEIGCQKDENGIGMHESVSVACTRRDHQDERRGRQSQEG